MNCITEGNIQRVVWVENEETATKKKCKYIGWLLEEVQNLVLNCSLLN